MAERRETLASLVAENGPPDRTWEHYYAARRACDLATPDAIHKFAAAAAAGESATLLSWLCNEREWMAARCLLDSLCSNRDAVVAEALSRATDDSRIFLRRAGGASPHTLLTDDERRNMLANSLLSERYEYIVAMAPSPAELAQLHGDVVAGLENRSGLRAHVARNALAWLRVVFGLDADGRAPAATKPARYPEASVAPAEL